MQPLLPHGPACQLTPMRWKPTKGSLTVLDVSPPLKLCNAEARMGLALLATFPGEAESYHCHL